MFNPTHFVKQVPAWIILTLVLCTSRTSIMLLLNQRFSDDGRSLKLVPQVLYGIEVRQACWPHHLLDAFTSQECSSYMYPSVWSGVVIHVHKCSTMGCSKWCKMWTQHFVNLSLRCQVASNLHKRCFPGKAYTTPHNYTPTTIGCNCLNTALCMLLSASPVSGHQCDAVHR